MHIIFSWQWKWFWRRPGCFWIDIHGVIIFWNFTFQNIPKENGKENGLKYWMNIRNDSRYLIKVRILDVRIFFWENGFRWWLFGLLVLRDPLYESERFKESYYNYPLSFLKTKLKCLSSLLQKYWENVTIFIHQILVLCVNNICVKQNITNKLRKIVTFLNFFSPRELIIWPTNPP